MMIPPLNPACRRCGCTQNNACLVRAPLAANAVDGCYWVEPGLCSACADPASRIRGPWKNLGTIKVAAVLILIGIAAVIVLCSVGCAAIDCGRPLAPPVSREQARSWAITCGAPWPPVPARPVSQPLNVSERVAL